MCSSDIDDEPRPKVKIPIAQAEPIPTIALAEEAEVTSKPVEGDQWYNRAADKSFIYRDGVWQLLPVCNPRKRIFLGTESIRDIPFYNVSSIPRHTTALLIARRAAGKTCLAKYLIKKRNLRHGQATYANPLSIYKDRIVDRFDSELLKKKEKKDKIAYLLLDDIQGSKDKNVTAMINNNLHVLTDVMVCAQSQMDISDVLILNADLYFLGKGSDIAKDPFIKRLILELEPYQFLVYDSIDERLLGKTNPKEVAILVLDDQ